LFKAFPVEPSCGQVGQPCLDPKAFFGIYSSAGFGGCHRREGSEMKLHGVGVVLAAGLLVQGAQAADMARVTSIRTTRVTRVAPMVPERAIARLVDQGLGYSVLHEAVGAPQQSYRVHVTCTITETFAQTYCPTPAYVASCPNARIVCQ
jgi:hypothetical protein